MKAPWPPLVAVAHGSSDPRAAATVTELTGLTVERASASGVRLTARAAYLGHALPPVSAVLESLWAAAQHQPGPGRSGTGSQAGRSGTGSQAGRDGTDRGASRRHDVVVLPLLLTPAYHSDTDLPAILREARSHLPELRIRYGQPLGPHPRLLRALERRLSEASGGGARAAAQETAIVLAAAGSSRPDANAAVARLASQWQSARGWRAVLPAYASAASPAPGEAVAGLLRSGARRVVVATYLLAPGFFADQVREQSLAAGAHAVSAPLGAAPELADLVMLRYLQAAQRVTGRRAFAI